MFWSRNMNMILELAFLTHMKYSFWVLNHVRLNDYNESGKVLCSKNSPVIDLDIAWSCCCSKITMKFYKGNIRKSHFPVIPL